MNDYFIYQHIYNTLKEHREQYYVDWTERPKKHVKLPYLFRVVWLVVKVTQGHILKWK